MIALHIMPGGLWLRHTATCARLLALANTPRASFFGGIKKAAQTGG